MKHFLIITTLLALYSQTVLAAPGDADAADSLDFDAFHQEKEGAIVIWDSDKSELGGFNEKKTTVTYEDDTAGKEPVAKPSANTIIEQDLTPNEARSEALRDAHDQERLSHGKGYDGQRFMIRARYSLDDHPASGNTVSSAMNQLYQEMARYCPQGWLKVKEWGLPVEQDFYLHYLFQCASADDAE